MKTTWDVASLFFLTGFQLSGINEIAIKFVSYFTLEDQSDLFLFSTRSLTKIINQPIYGVFLKD